MRRFLKVRILPLLLLTIAVASSGCASNTKTDTTGQKDSTSPSTTESKETAWKGTITMYAQAYTPNAKKKSASTKSLHMLRTVADEYEKAHPGITIKFVDEDFKDYTQTIRVKAAAGELFDVFWAQWADLNGTFPKGVAEDLTSYFNMPNPYITDHPTWLDAMNQTVVNETASADGKHYNINGDYVATAFFFNKDLFDKAGITQIPKSWSEMLEVSKKLQSAGITALSQAPEYSWFQRHFLTDFYTEEFETISSYDKNPGISALDQTVAIQKGILSTKDDRFMGWWPLFKQFTDTWKKDYVTADPGIVSENARNDFLAGKSAIIYDGSWLPSIANEANIKFDISSFNFPVLSKSDIAMTSGEDVSGAVGGPNGAFQFAIATKEANASMKEAGKKEAVLNWLQFVGTPTNIEKIVNEKGTFIPTWPGTKPIASMADLSTQASKELKAIGVGDSSPNLSKDLQRTFGLYLSGNLDIDKAKAAVQKALDASVQDFKTKNNTDFSKY